MSFYKETKNDPFEQFQEWYDLVSGKNQSFFTKIYMAVMHRLLSFIMPAMNRIHSNAMVLATADAEGKANARVVLLKAYSEQGFSFYTNYDSQKAHEIAENPQATLVFYWDYPPRQVRISGKLEKTTYEDSNAYWLSRPRGSRISAMASPQSSVIESKKILESKVTELESQYKDQEIECPKNWGGYILKPERFEFWQARANRLHDRVEYVPKDSGWEKRILAP